MMKAKFPIHVRKKIEGSTLVIALLTLAVLSVVGTTVLMSVTARYGYTQQAVGWEKALGMAEAGADFGLANCRWTVNGNSTPWTGWTKFVSNNQPWAPVTPAQANLELTAGRTIAYDLPSGSFVGSGQGATNGWYHVEVDTPPSMVIGGNPWYRIRSTGYIGLPGRARAGNDSPDGTKAQGELRKIDLRVDHFIARYGDYAHQTPTAVSVAGTPQAARRLEVIAQPVTPFGFAMVAAAPSGSPLGMPMVDSYNPADTVNYPDGLYSSAPRNPATGVGTNADVYINAPISSLGSNVYGDVSTNNGTLTKTSNISGSVTNLGTPRVIPPVTAPLWAVVAGAPSSTLVAGTTVSPVYRSWSSISGLTVTLPAGQATGVANIYVTGDVTGGITVAQGVTLRIWMEGDFSMKARDINNLNNNAANLQIYGIDPPAGQSRSINIGSGNPGYEYIVFDCPSYDFHVVGNPDFVGAIIAKSLNGNGNTTWHYDETLAGAGIPTDYKRAMWVEDER